MKNFIKHIGVWIFVVLAGFVSIYVAAQASSVSIEANIGSFVQYIGSLFVTSDGTPSGQPIISVDTNGLSLYDLTRENAGPGLVGVNADGQVVMTRPLSYTTLPDTSTPQQLENNHAYIVPYWDERSETNVVFPSTCVVGDQIQIHAMQLPISLDTVGDMRIIGPYLEGNGYGYGSTNAFVEYESYLFYDKLGYSQTPSGYGYGVGPDYPFDRCEYMGRDPDTLQSIYDCGYGVSPSGYSAQILPVKDLSFLCIVQDKYLMHAEYFAINGLLNQIDAMSFGGYGYGDPHGEGYPNPFGYGYGG